MSPFPRMPAFRHRCAPCGTCGSTGFVNLDDEGEVQTDCTTCEGQSRPCDCQEHYDAEGERRYDAWKNGDYDL